MITVLMSVYQNDNAYFFECALKSIEMQSYLPSEVVIVKDGPVNDSINDVIQFYSKRLKVKSFQLDKNYGLPVALNYGLKHVTTPWVARFDADDINLPNRFYEQMRVIEDGGVDVFGGHIKEFDFDFRNFSRPIFPPAPPMFSITKDLFVFNSANLANFLAKESTAPPAVVGTIIEV